MPLTRDNRTAVMTPVTPTEAQAQAISQLYHAGERLIRAIQELTPQSADQSAAIRHVREAVWTAREAVLLDGAV